MQLFDAGAAAPPTYALKTWGHDESRRRLATLGGRGRLAQVVLLVGPPGTGKMALGHWLAQALLCPHAVDGNPCAACRTCRLVAQLGHPDLTVLDPPLRIEASRDLQRQVCLAPAEGNRRVALVPGIDQASLGAANSLLKLLEEPPPHLSIVLTAGEPAGVLPTIRSRSQLIMLKTPTAKAVREALSAAGCVAEIADQLAFLAGGRVGWALAQAPDFERALKDERRWSEVADRLGQATASERLAAVSGKLDAEAATEALASWRRWWRQRLQADLRQPDEQRSPATPRLAVRMLRLVDAACRQLEAKTLPNLVLETVVLAWPPLSTR